jgi:hypothetical protein
MSVNGYCEAAAMGRELCASQCKECDRQEHISFSSERGSTFSFNPIGYARKQDLLLYRPVVIMYDAPIEPENGHEAVPLYSQDQVEAYIATAIAAAARDAEQKVLDEREACAKAAENVRQVPYEANWVIAQAIRARSADRAGKVG